MHRMQSGGWPYSKVMHNFIISGLQNCRIGGLMFDSILYLKFNSKQSSTRDLAKEILYICSSIYPRKRVLLADKSVLYHIASQIWQLLQHGMGS